MDDNVAGSSESSEKVQELHLFLFVTVFLFPFLTLAFVGAYGFIIWIMQLIMGPPSA